MSDLALPSNRSGRYANEVSKGLPDADWQKQLEQAASEAPTQSKDWMSPEYEKHIQGIRARYPMLTQLLLRPKAIDNANLSDIATTNKYARLADAYNAGYRYVAEGGAPTANPEAYTGANTSLQAVEKLDTQDQKQMDQLRQAQGELRQYMTGEESHAQRDFLRRKMDEMVKLTDREYQQQWFNSDESKRRMSALFDSWKTMNEAEFTAVMEKLSIPKQKAEDIMSKIKSGDYIGAAYLANAHGITPMNIDQMFQYGATAQIASQLAKGEVPSPELLAQQIGKVKGMQVVEEYAGLFNYAKNSASSPEIRKLATFASEALDTAITAGGHLLNVAEPLMWGAIINIILKEVGARVLDVFAIGGNAVTGGIPAAAAGGGAP
jgi:hypothetical protein